MAAIAQFALTKPVCTVAKAQAAKPAARAGHVALGSTRFMGSTAQLSASARQMPVRQLTALVAALEVDEAPAAAPAQKKMSMSRKDRNRSKRFKEIAVKTNPKTAITPAEACAQLIVIAPTRPSTRKHPTPSSAGRHPGQVTGNRGKGRDIRGSRAGPGRAQCLIGIRRAVRAGHRLRQVPRVRRGAHPPQH
mmetsp:Transcript_35122/g.110995  ORF Transcript_35122/g.110995 Transcript_35122/m.110995 type:complete len:192 (+) Transcript_35122:346-921(+)